MNTTNGRTPFGLLLAMSQSGTIHVVWIHERWFTKELIKTERSAIGRFVDLALLDSITQGHGGAYRDLDLGVAPYRNIDDYRKADRDYDSLLKIQDRVAKELRKQAERSD